jgi:twinkle protein
VRKPTDEEFMQLNVIDINAKVERVANLFGMAEFENDVLALETGGVNRDAFKPFWDQFGDKFVLRPRELSIFFGSRGSYKSTVVTYLAAQFLLEGAGKVGLLSYELDPADVLLLLTTQMANTVDYHLGFRKRVLDRFNDKILMIDEMTDAPHSAIAKIKACLEADCKLVILDCLQRVNMPSNDIDLERQFVIETTNLARQHNAHVIVVHHSRKGSHHDGDNPFPTVDDLKGSGGLADNAMNVVAVWSNKKKKELQWAMEKEGHQPTIEERDLLDMPDVVLDVKKQRKGRFEGRIGLWRTEARAFHRKGARVPTL